MLGRVLVGQELLSEDILLSPPRVCLENLQGEFIIAGLILLLHHDLVSD